jgi:hypothetical protein
MLLAHTLLGIGWWARSGVDAVGLLVLAALTVGLLALLGRRLPFPEAA